MSHRTLQGTHAGFEPSVGSPHLAVRLGAVRRGSVRVLDGWTGALPLPSVCGLVGLNGAGKSSLMLAVAGALRVRAARAEVARLAADGSRRPATLALATQQSTLPPWLDAAGICRLHGLELERLIGRFPGLLLGELGTRRADTYSGGQAQALAVALALGADADLTMLDEPLAALDVRRRRALLDVLVERREGGGGGAVLLSSQSAADLHAACDRLVVLSGGQVVFDGATAALVAGAGANGAGAAEGSARLEARLLALAGGPQEPPPVPPGRRRR